MKLMMNLMAIIVMFFLFATSARAKSLHIVHVDSKTFEDLNHSQVNLYDSKRLNDEGTRGGGSSDLWEMRDFCMLLSFHRSDLLARFSDVDWQSVKEDELQKRIQAGLMKDPVQMINSMKIRVQERCYLKGKRSHVLLTNDFKSLCIETSVAESDFGMIFDLLLAEAMETDQIFSQFKKQEYVHFNYQKHFQVVTVSEMVSIQRLFNVSQPLPSSVLVPDRCIHVFTDDTEHDVAYSSLESSIVEKRLHPNGKVLLKLSSGYAICE